MCAVEMSSISTCNWRDGAECQFPQLLDTVTEYHGRNYCRAHLPLVAGGKDTQWTQEWVRSVTKDSKGTEVDLTGMTFPAPVALSPNRIDFQNKRYKLHACDFGDRLEICGSSSEGDFREAVFGVGVTLLGSWNDRSFVCLVCRGRVRFDLMQMTGQANFTGAHFKKGSATFTGFSRLSRLVFDSAVFDHAPRFSDEPLPQQTTFTGAKFLTTPKGAEGRYRHLRNLLGANRARDWEGFFYAYEKRGHRKSLPLGFTRLVSWLYDVASAYGQSYARAFWSLVAVQVLFGFGYQYEAGRLGWGRIDLDMVAFTLAQVARPFELLSARSRDGGLFGVVPANTTHLSWWAIATFAQSVLSLALVALFLLALRWRFRRE